MKTKPLGNIFIGCYQGLVVTGKTRKEAKAKLIKAVFGV